MPIRLEVGPKDLKQGQCVAVRRDTGEKVVLRDAETENRIKLLLEEIQNNLFKRYLSSNMYNEYSLSSKRVDPSGSYSVIFFSMKTSVLF